MIRAVVFDIGETLVRDDRYWASWADWLGVPRHTLSALVGAVTAMGLDNAEAVRLLRPGIDLHEERRAREEWGVAKPDPAFFRRVVELGGAAPGETVYVGDHPANDIIPAKGEGLLTCMIQRGPWGHLWGNDPVILNSVDWRIDSIQELPSLLHGSSRWS